MRVARITIVTDAKIATIKAIRTVRACDLIIAKDMVTQGFYVKPEHYNSFIENWSDVENIFRADCVYSGDRYLSINISMVEIDMPLIW